MSFRGRSSADHTNRGNHHYETVHRGASDGRALMVIAMKRPAVPLKVRLAVLERQAFIDREFKSDIDRRFCWDWYKLSCKGESISHKIKWLMLALFMDGKPELDQAPALCLRKFNPKTGRYTPDANNPNYLVYRAKDEHLQKTTGRKAGAARTVTAKGSDLWLRKKWKKLESPKRSKSKIASRPFPRVRSSFVRPVGKGS